MLGRQEILDAMQFDLPGVLTPLHQGGAAPRSFTYQFAQSGTPADFGIFNQSFTGWTPLSPADRAAVRAAMDHIETVVNIRFTQVTGNPDPEMNIGRVTLPAGTDGLGGFRYTPDPGGKLASWDNFAVFNSGLSLPAAPGVILHMIGHALTLRHPFEGPAPVPVAFRNAKYSIMADDPNPDTGAPGDRLMLFDILALQERWGANLSHRTGNDIYTAPAPGDVVTIWDAGGTDTLDATVRAGGVRLDLREGAFSRFGAHDDLAIAFGAVIENAIGGSGNDLLTGNRVANVLAGGAGADTLDGGLARDLASYADADAGVAADLINGGSAGDAAGDAFTSIEDLRGSAHGDDLRGTNGVNILNGDGGNDFLFDRGGNDTLIGGAGDDTMAGGDGHDVLSGGDGNDRSAGGAGNDRHVAGAGDDTMIGGGGNDTMLGGAGADTVFDGPGNSRLFGNAGNDRLIGAGGNDEINGGTGRDIMNGGAGVDRLAGGSGNDFMVGGAGADIFVFRDGMGSDTVGDHAIGTDRLFIAASLAGTSNPAVLAAAAQLVGQDVVFDFGGGNMLTLTGLGTTQGIEGDITLI